MYVCVSARCLCVCLYECVRVCSRTQVKCVRTCVQVCLHACMHMCKCMPCAVCVRSHVCTCPGCQAQQFQLELVLPSRQLLTFKDLQPLQIAPHLQTACSAARTNWLCWASCGVLSWPCRPHLPLVFRLHLLLGLACLLPPFALQSSPCSVGARGSEAYASAYCRLFRSLVHWRGK